MDTRIDGLHALVSGGSQGIGAAAARALAQEGARLTLLARDEQHLQATLATLAGADHTYLVADMSDTAALQHAMEEHVRMHGPVHILVNNSGGPAPGLAHEAGTDLFERAFRQHLLAFQTLVRNTVPGMKDAGHGRIINVISTSVKVPLPNLGVSNTVRGAVAQWSKTLANELGRFNITVNNVLPGATSTGRLEAIVRNNAAKRNVSEGQAAEEMMAEIPLRRFAKPEEVAAAICFLAGPSAAYINGINLPVDGGRTGCL